MNLLSKIKIGGLALLAGIAWALKMRNDAIAAKLENAQAEAAAEKSARQSEKAVRQAQSQARREAQDHETEKRRERRDNKPVGGNASDRLRR